MQAAVKVLIGIVLVIASVWWIIQGSTQYSATIFGITHSGIQDLITVLNGAIPVLIFLLGIFIVWLEIDEMKIEKELKKRK
jgi:uncharacterized membrane protein YwzB